MLRRFLAVSPINIKRRESTLPAGRSYTNHRERHILSYVVMTFTRKLQQKDKGLVHGTGIFSYTFHVRQRH